MKTTFRFIIAAMAAVAVFTSCQKELANETASKTADGVRTISVQFDNSTKASLDGLKPAFTDGDKIRVSNSTKSEELEVSVSGTTASFTTTLSGALTAIYPSTAAVLSSGEADAPIASSNNFKVLATQDGTVAKAIIAKAEIAEGSSGATFTGVTALFEITPPSGATSITITSLNKIDATTGQRSTTANAEAINTTGEDATAKCKITVSVSGGKAYVSLVPGVNLTDLSFDAGGAAGLKGIPTSKLSGKDDVTVANAKYTIDSQNWHPYVTIGSKKWATMNIGANNANDAGTYFMWGAIEKAYTGISSNTFTFGSKPSTYNNTTWDASKCFAWNNCPWTNGVYNSSTKKNVFTKYIPSDKSDYWGGSDSPDNKTTLDLADDAANANWGGSWRMPTKEEFDELAAKKLSFSSGYYFGESNENKIFLPAAGYGHGTDLYNAGDYGYYWSSSLFTDNPFNAYSLYFYGGGADTNGNYRYLGQSVRALSE